MDAECEKDVMLWSVRGGLCSRMRATATKKDIWDENNFNKKQNDNLRNELRQLI